jgi:hypothetical protein
MNLFAIRLYQNNNCPAMKRKILTLVLAWLLVAPSWACDICGCASGNFFFGALPLYRNHFVGLRYRQTNWKSWYDRADNRLHSSEKFHTAEVWGRWNPGAKMQITASLPYSINYQWMDGVEKREKGVGDALAVLSYNVLDNILLTAQNKNIQQVWWVGSGLKLPTGKYAFRENSSDVANPNFQLGTGSLDAIFQTLYSIRYQRVGISVDGTFKLNGTNRFDYRFGNRLQANASVYTVQKIKSVGLMPYAGFGAEWMKQDKDAGKPNTYTGGYLYQAQAGTDVYLKQWSLGAGMRVPLAQQIGGGVLESNISFFVQLNYLIGPNTLLQSKSKK